MSKKNKCPAHEVRIVESKKGPVVKGGSESTRKRWQELIDERLKLWHTDKNAARKRMQEDRIKMQEEKKGS